MAKTEFIITDEEIETIKKLLLNRNFYKDIKEILDNLEKFEDKTKEDLRRLIRNSGKTNMIQIEKLQELIE